MQRFPVVLAALVLASGCNFQLGRTVTSSFTLVLDQKAEREEVVALELGPEDVLGLSTEYGRIEVVAVAADDARAGRPELRAKLEASGRTKEEAQAVLDRFRVEVVQGPEGPQVRLVGEPLELDEGSLSAKLWAHADFVATVPAGTKVAADSGSGEIVTRGTLGDLQLETDYGAITIDEARGAVRAKSGSGKVQAARLDCRASGGAAELESGYGSIEVKEAQAARLTCVSGSGDIRVGSAEVDALELTTGYGSVEVEQARGAVRADSGSGNVRLRDVHGAIKAESDYGTIEIEGVLTALEAKSGSGTVRAKARPESRMESDWELASSYGAVVLAVPAGFACELDARTDYGGIESDFPVTIEAGKRKDGRELKGTVGTGGKTVRLTSGSGDVALKKE